MMDEENEGFSWTYLDSDDLASEAQAGIQPSTECPESLMPFFYFQPQVQAPPMPSLPPMSPVQQEDYSMSTSVNHPPMDAVMLHDNQASSELYAHLYQTSINHVSAAARVESAEPVSLPYTTCAGDSQAPVLVEDHRQYIPESSIAPRSDRSSGTVVPHVGALDTGAPSPLAPLVSISPRMTDSLAHALTGKAEISQMGDHSVIRTNIASTAVRSAAKKRRRHSPKYVCTLCGDLFTTRPNKERHERAHYGIKPFKCPCGMSFTSRTDLKRHCRCAGHESDTSS